MIMIIIDMPPITLYSSFVFVLDNHENQQNILQILWIAPQSFRFVIRVNICVKKQQQKTTLTDFAFSNLCLRLMEFFVLGISKTASSSIAILDNGCVLHSWKLLKDVMQIKCNAAICMKLKDMNLKNFFFFKFP